MSARRRPGRPPRDEAPARPVAVRLTAADAAALRARPEGASAALRAALSAHGPALARARMARRAPPPAAEGPRTVQMAVRLSPTERRWAETLGQGSAAQGLRLALGRAQKTWDTKLDAARGRLREAAEALGAEAMGYETRARGRRPQPGHNRTHGGPLPGPKKATVSGWTPETAEKVKKAQ